MKLDPDAFSSESGNLHWRFWTTPRLGQFDIATCSHDDGWGPSPAGLAHLERALGLVEELYDRAQAAAEAAWLDHYQGAARPKETWSLTRLFAGDDGRLVLTLYEGDYDTYGAWDVTMIADQATLTLRRAV